MTAEPQMKPLTSKGEQLALQIARYKSHIEQAAQVRDAMNDGLQQTRQIDQEVHQLQEKRRAIMGHIEAMKSTTLFFVCEAREQVGVLLGLGMSMEQIAELTPDAMVGALSQIDVVEQLVPKSVRDTVLAIVEEAKK